MACPDWPVCHPSDVVDEGLSQARVHDELNKAVTDTVGPWGAVACVSQCFPYLGNN